MLATGLVAYVAIPNVHTTQVLQTLPLPSPGPLQIPGGAVVEVSQNLSIVDTRQNALLVNLTILSGQEKPSAMLFQVFQKNQTRSCPDTTGRSYLFNREVTNGTYQASIPSSGLYCFVFDNEASIGAKTVTLATSIISSFEQVQVASDGEMNIVGLVSGAIGFLVLVAGVMKKTVIPWE